MGILCILYLIYLKPFISTMRYNKDQKGAPSFRKKNMFAKESLTECKKSTAIKRCKRQE